MAKSCSGGAERIDAQGKSAGITFGRQTLNCDSVGVCVFGWLLGSQAANVFLPKKKVKLVRAFSRNQ